MSTSKPGRDGNSRGEEADARSVGDPERGRARAGDGLAADRPSSHRYEAGDVVFAKGSRGNSMFVIVEGGVQVESGGAELVLTTLHVGQSFGEIALIDEGVRTATVRAVATPTRLVEIDKARFVYLVGQQPAFALTVLRGLARRVKALTATEPASPGEAP